MTAKESIESGRKAFREERWKEAYHQFSEMETIKEPEDFQMLAVSAYLTGHFPQSIKAWTSAHSNYLNEENYSGAIQCAFWIGLTLMYKGESTRGGAWFKRATELLKKYAPSSSAKGYLLLPLALKELAGRNPGVSLEHFTQAGDVGYDYKDQDLIALSKLGCGQALIRLNDIREGLKSLDSAMIAVESGILSPIVVGIIYCAVIETCMEIFELARAQEWTAALGDWCDTHPQMVPFRGQCLTRRSEIMMLHGDWENALTEAEYAISLLTENGGEPAAGAAYYQLGDILRLQGKFRQAEEAYLMANRYGKEPQPGFALLRLCQGKPVKAGIAISKAKKESLRHNEKALVLSAYIEIMLENEELDNAVSAGEELRELASFQGSDLITAINEMGSARIMLAKNEGQFAIERLQKARARWEQVKAPYEAARTRMLCGFAWKMIGDVDSAGMELQAARIMFEQLGAYPDLKKLAELTGSPSAPKVRISNREKEVLQLVVSGASNKKIADQLFISERTVERHISNIFHKLEVSSRTEAAAYALKHNLL